MCNVRARALWEEARERLQLLIPVGARLVERGRALLCLLLVVVSARRNEIFERRRTGVGQPLEELLRRVVERRVAFTER